MLKIWTIAWKKHNEKYDSPSFWLTTYFAMFGVFQHSDGILMGTNSAHLLAVWGIDYFIQTCSLNIDRHTSHPKLNNNKFTPIFKSVQLYIKQTKRLSHSDDTSFIEFSYFSFVIFSLHCCFIFPTNMTILYCYLKI